jgi:glutamate-1-semialdehyde 2,1-aminomutase
MLDQGISLAPSAYEAIFTSLSHTDSDLNRTIEAAGKAAEVVARIPG